MATKLTKTITREIDLAGRPFTVTVGPAASRSRAAVGLSWATIYEGGTGSTGALNKSGADA